MIYLIDVMLQSDHKEIKKMEQNYNMSLNL